MGGCANKGSYLLPIFLTVWVLPKNLINTRRVFWGVGGGDFEIIPLKYLIAFGCDLGFGCPR